MDNEPDGRSSQLLQELARAASAMRLAASEEDVLAQLRESVQRALGDARVTLAVPSPTTPEGVVRPPPGAPPGALVVPLLDREGVALGTIEVAPAPGAPPVSAAEEAALAVLAELATTAVKKRRGAAELAAGQHLLDAVFEALPVGVAVADADGSVVRSNGALERVLRVEEPLPETVVAGIPPRGMQALHPDGTPYAQHEYPLQRALAGETVMNEEVRFVFGDGSDGWVIATAAPLRAGGPVTGGVVAVADVTERVRAMQAITEAEQRLARALEVTSTAVWEWNATTGEMHATGRLEELHGVMLDDLRRFPDWTLDHVHPADRARLVAAVEHAGRDQSGYVVQYRVLLPDGGERWLESRATAEQRENGDIVLLGVTRDIDRERRANLAAADTAELNRLVLDNAMELLGLLDRDGCYLFASRSHELVLGWPPADLLGRAPLELVHPDDLDDVLADFAALSDGHRSQLRPHRLRRADGSYALVESTIVRIRDESGRTRHLLVSARDLSARAEREAALQASEARFRVLFEHAPIGISLLDPDGRWLAANEAFRALVGYSVDELGELTLTALAEDEHREAAAALIQGALFNPDGRIETEARLVGRTGEPVWVWLSATVVGESSPGTRPEYVIVMAQDMSRRKQLEEQLRQSQKMESVGRLAGGIAHDFNNLLTVVTGYVGVLQRSLEGSPHAQSLAQIGRAAERGAALTRQLLAFSRQQVLTPRLVDLGEIVAGTSAMLELLVGEDVRVVRHLAEQPLAVYVDPGQVEQVVVNLVVNARDAMPEGGTLVIETGIAEFDAAYVRTHAETRPGRYALLAVSDTGSGMDEATLSKAFDPFFTTKGAVGTGLGLSTVHGIVHQSGGVVYAYSEPGRGTTFKVYLPLAAAAPEQLQPHGEDDVPTGSETVLLVEDEPELRQLVRTLLEDLGYAVVAAASAEEAVLLLESEPSAPEPALLLTDLVLTGMNGRRLAEHVRVLHPGIRTLFMSGYTGDAVTHHDDLNPGTHFLQKPFTSADLARYVRRALAG